MLVDYPGACAVNRRDSTAPIRAQRRRCVGIDHFAELSIAGLAISLAAPFPFAAVLERPPHHPLGREIAVVSLLWAATFAIAGGAVLTQGHFAQFGLLVAAAELMAGAGIWSARSPAPGPPDDGGGDDGPDGDAPPGPPTLTVPAEYWERWEKSLRELEPSG